MQLFGGMGDRERTIVPRLDDDSGMFGMQFNVGLYYKDRILQGSVENGVAGFAGQLNRPRGMEQNYRYLAEGAYNPKLTPQEFYEGYARRLFGEAAAPEMEKAFAILEANEEYLGWTQKGNFGCCGPISEVSMAHRLYQQPNPFDGPKDWGGFIKRSLDTNRYYEQAAINLQQALDLMKAAEPKVASHGQEELHYLMNKTESYRMHLETLVTVRKAYIAFDEAFRLWKAGTIDRAELVRRLDDSMVMFDEAKADGAANDGEVCRSDRSSFRHGRAVPGKSVPRHRIGIGGANDAEYRELSPREGIHEARGVGQDLLQFPAVLIDAVREGLPRSVVKDVFC